jgi:LytS/YehU family sensor histidine kinase
MNLRRPAAWAWLFVLCVAVGLFDFGHFYLDDLARAQADAPWRRLMEELTAAISTFFLLPLILFVTRRAPMTRGTWARATAANLACLVVYTCAHTTLIAVSRSIVSPLIGLGPYDYGIMSYRYPMEATSDTIWYVIIATTSYLSLRSHAARVAELRTADLQRQLAQAQLENLRLQLNPHFLFNTLNAISSVMYEDVRKADAMLAKLSDFLRTVLAASGVANVSLDEELAVERQYVDIMTTRLERRLHLSVRVAEGVSGALVPFMLLQPLIENSIRHGMRDRASLALEIDASRRDGRTIIEVRDDGSGCAPQARSGIGLTNVRSRLAHLYGDAASFSLEARDGGGTRAILTFPFALEAAS